MSAASPFVQTVRGPVEPSALGRTLMHEHLVWDWIGAMGEGPQLAATWPVERIVQKLAAAAEDGVGCVVDVSPDNAGAHPLVFALIAAQAPCHVVCATGYYCAEAVPLPRSVYPPNDATTIGERFLDAARYGVARSGVKPGILKVATSAATVTPVEEQIVRAAAYAQRRTGLPITTHTHYTLQAERQIDILEDAGADLDRVVIGHMGWGTGPQDFDVHERLIRRGVTIGLDLLGLWSVRSVEDYAQMAFDLIEAGYASNFIVSHDASVYARGLSSIVGTEGKEDYGRPEDYAGKLTIATRELLPLLRERGVSEEVLSTIMVDNPRRILTIDPGRYPETADNVLWEPDPTDVLRAGDGELVAAMYASAGDTA